MSDKCPMTDIVLPETNREQITGCVDGSLRYRIAYAIAQADGDLPGMEPASCDYEMADAVIAALGMYRQDVYSNAYSKKTRYVTEWMSLTDDTTGDVNHD